MINKPWQVYSRVWNGGGEGGADPVFPLFFHENPASRTSLIAITNIVFFRIPHQCRKSPWPARFGSSYFIRPYNLHYLLFSEKGALLCHHPYCFPSQSQTLFAIDATSPVKVKSIKSRIPLTFPESSAVFWANPWSREYPSSRPGKNQNQHPLTCQLHIQQRQVKLCITISVKVNFVTKYAWNRMQLN